MSKIIKKGDSIKCAKAVSDDFMDGCDYQVEKVSKTGHVFCYSDNGELVSIDYPHDQNYGKFERVS